MDHLLDRVEALTQQLQTLQQQTHALQQHTHTVTRRLRWWRGLACGLIGLAGLAWMLPAVIAQEDASTGGQRGLAPRVAALESLLTHFSREGNDVTLTGANLHLVNGLGRTSCTDEQFEPIPNCPNGLGNLIVGYNEPRGGDEDVHTGSHNVIVGSQHNFSRVGGLVVGDFNEISGDFAVVSGGSFNLASGTWAVVSGGRDNTASGEFSSVSGGSFNLASGTWAVVSGGGVSGGGLGDTPPIGRGNEASGTLAVVIGGSGNLASGDFSSVSGGGGLEFSTDEGQNTASGVLSSIGGGSGNLASGDFSSVSGGQNRTATGEFDWVAGALLEDD